MLEQIKERFGIEKGLFYLLMLIILVAFIAAFYLFFSYVSKSVTLVAPKQGTDLELGKEYEIKWTARGVDKVGIVLFNGDKPEWIAQNLDAKQGVYKWTLKSSHAYGSNFWFAVFDYPWRKGSSIDYSDGPVKITYPELLNCDKLTIENAWPYLISNTPGLRRLFITSESYNGNLGGFDGADKKCQDSADKLGYGGKWVAFVGGDTDEETAVSRLGQTTRKTEGFFVDAQPALELRDELSCHRLLGSNLNDFIKKLSNNRVINEQKLEKNFLADITNIWLGRVDVNSKKNCIYADGPSYVKDQEKYSFSTTCQNWTQGVKVVPGYIAGVKLDSSFSSCYTPRGTFTYALGLAGLGTGFLSNQTYTASSAKFCDMSQKLICIED
jgi:hypothetical protein